MSSDGSQSTASSKSTSAKSRSGILFRAWSFRLTIKADLSNAVDKANYLKEHMSNRTVIERPLYVSSLIAFYDASQLSGVPDSDDLVSRLEESMKINEATRSNQSFCDCDFMLIRYLFHNPKEADFNLLGTSMDSWNIEVQNFNARKINHVIQK
jgi:hypothetical protein